MSQCTKRQLDSEREAFIMCEELHTKNKEIYHYYICPKCEKYHVAHAIPAHKRRKAFAISRGYKRGR